MPDLLPRPETPRNATFRREFYRRWGRENCIVSGVSRRVEYGLFRQTLSIKCIARGAETYFVDRRRVTVSDDTWLVLNEGRTYASVLDTPNEAYSFSIFFRPGLASEVAADLGRTLPGSLEDGGAPRLADIEFDEALRPHDAGITPVLRYIQRQVVAGLKDEHWLEEQCQFLVARLIRSHLRKVQPMSAELAALRPAKRQEILRRLAGSMDFMHARLSDDIGLQDLAAAAHLSRFHFLRLFSLVYGRTPMAALRELRTRRALALMEATSLSAGEIAERVGMSRVALWRALRQNQGAGAREVRRLAVLSKAAFLSRASAAQSFTFTPSRKVRPSAS